MIVRRACFLLALCLVTGCGVSTDLGTIHPAKKAPAPKAESTRAVAAEKKAEPKEGQP